MRATIVQKDKNNHSVWIQHYASFIYMTRFPRTLNVLIEGIEMPWVLSRTYSEECAKSKRIHQVPMVRASKALVARLTPALLVANRIVSDG